MKSWKRVSFYNFLLLILLQAFTYGNNIYYVATTGNDSNSGGSTDPFATIQKGIDTAISGDTVIVNPGTYQESLNFNGKNITVTSTDIYDWQGIIANTIIDPAGSVSAVTFNSGENNTAILSGFTIKEGLNGVYCDNNSDPTITNCAIESHSNSGIEYTNNSNPVINNGYIHSCGYGVKASGVSNTTLKNLVIYNNEYGIYFNNSGLIANVIHCTLSNNNIGIHNTSGTIAIINSILWNTTDDLYNCSATYSCISKQEDSSGIGNINSIPSFDVNANNFTLANNSPCIDSANGLVGTPTDLLGFPRLDDTKIDTGAGSPTYADMGAFEYFSINVSEIKFNHNLDNSDTDAIDMRDRQFPETGPVETFDWSTSTPNSHAAYVINSSVDIKANFSCSWNNSVNLVIGATTVSNDVFATPNDKPASISGSSSPFINFDLTPTIPGIITKREIQWQWNIKPENGGSTVNLNTTGTHNMYTVFNEPPDLHVNTVGTQINPSLEILSLACHWTDGSNTKRQACEKIMDNGIAKHYFYEAGSCAGQTESFRYLVNTLGVDTLTKVMDTSNVPSGLPRENYTIRAKAIAGGIINPFYSLILPIKQPFNSHTWAQALVEPNGGGALQYNNYCPTFGLSGYGVMNSDSFIEARVFSDYYSFESSSHIPLKEITNLYQWRSPNGLPIVEDFEDALNGLSWSSSSGVENGEYLLENEETLSTYYWSACSFPLPDYQGFPLIDGGTSAFCNGEFPRIGGQKTTIGWRRIHVKYTRRTENFNGNGTDKFYVEVLNKAPDLVSDFNNSIHWTIIETIETNENSTTVDILCPEVIDNNPDFILRFRADLESSGAKAIVEHVEVYGEDWCGLPFGGDGFEGGSFDFGGISHGNWKHAGASINCIQTCPGTTVDLNGNYYDVTLEQDGYIEKSISTEGWGDLVLEYSRELFVNDANASLIVEFCDGPCDQTTPFLMEEIKNNHPDPTYSAGIIKRPIGWQAYDNPNFTFRIRMNGNDAADKAYIDDIMITGQPLAHSYEDNNLEVDGKKSWLSILQQHGDINGDGKVDNIDLNLFIAAPFNSQEGDPGYNVNADLNHDGFITGGDSGVLLNTLNCDINEDGYINCDDVDLIAAAFNTVPGDPNYNPDADLNGDNAVTGGDVAILVTLLNNLGVTCP